MNTVKLGRRALVATAVTALILGTARAASAQAPFFEGVGDLPGGEFFSIVGDVSGNGATVVGQSESASGLEAVLWTRAAGLVGLGDLPGGTFHSTANGISSDGSTIVGFGNGVTDPLFGLVIGGEAFRWTQPGGMVGLGDLPGGSDFSFAVGASADGSVVAGNGNVVFDPLGIGFRSEAFRWTQAGGIVGLGDLPGGEIHSFATCVSADGNVVVGAGNLNDVTGQGGEAFRWTQAGGMVGLGFLPGGLDTSAANGVSGDGSTVVGFAFVGAQRADAFRWTESGGMLSLGQVVGYEISAANSASFDGSIIVGQLQSLQNDSDAMIWEKASGMRVLADVLVNQHGLNLDGWQLSIAIGVSADGGTITGWGTNPNGEFEGWVARLPAGSPCPADLNNDGIVDLADLGILLADFGCTPPGPCLGDINGDGATDLSDLGVLLASFGQVCP